MWQVMSKAARQQGRVLLCHQGVEVMISSRNLFQS